MRKNEVTEGTYERGIKIEHQSKTTDRSKEKREASSAHTRGRTENLIWARKV